MSANNTLENDLLELRLMGTDPSWRASANGYFALFTGDPGETGSLTDECADASYARVAGVKATDWTDGGSTFSNAVQVNWPTLAGSGADLTHWAWVSSSSGAVTYMVSGALSTPVPWAPGVKPVAEIGALTVNAD